MSEFSALVRFYLIFSLSVKYIVQECSFFKLGGNVFKTTPYILTYSTALMAPLLSVDYVDKA